MKFRVVCSVPPFVRFTLFCKNGDNVRREFASSVNFEFPILHFDRVARERVGVQKW